VTQGKTLATRPVFLEIQLRQAAGNASRRSSELGGLGVSCNARRELRPDVPGQPRDLRGVRGDLFRHLDRSAPSLAALRVHARCVGRGVILGELLQPVSQRLCTRDGLVVAGELHGKLDGARRKRGG
jgi:hypothetical protein